MVWIVLIGALASVACLFLLVRFGRLPPWSHRDVLAFIALVATIAGAMILTLMKWNLSNKFNAMADRLITELVRDRPTDVNAAVGQALQTIVGALTWDLKLTSIGILIVLLSLGLVISSRVIRGKIWGSEFELSGDSKQAAAAAGARAATEAAGREADSIEQGKPPAVSTDGELPESEKLP